VKVKSFLKKFKSDPGIFPDNDLYDWHKDPWKSFEAISSSLNHKKFRPSNFQTLMYILYRIVMTAEANRKTAPIDLNLKPLHKTLEALYHIIESGEWEEMLAIDVENDTNDALYLSHIIIYGLKILSYCGNSKSLKILLLFVSPNVSKLENNYWKIHSNTISSEFEDIQNTSFKAIKKIVTKGSKLHHNKNEGVQIYISKEDREIVKQTMINGQLKQKVMGLKCRCEKSYSELEFSEEDVESEEKYLCDVCKDYFFVYECYFCKVCTIQFCKYCVWDSINSENHDNALEIMRFLNDENVIPHILPYINSIDEAQTVIVLKTLHDHNYPRLDEYLFEIINTKEDESYLVDSAIRILGENGNEEHVEILIEKLRIYSRGRSISSRNSRDVVEEALANLHKYSNDYLFKILYTEYNLPKGFENSVKRIRNKIKDYKKPRSDDNWYSDLVEWRQKEFENSDFAYSNNILTHTQMRSIYKRQPEKYEELMDYEIGAYKVNKYGQEILNIVTKNLPDVGKSKKEIGPWKLPKKIEEILELKLPKILEEKKDMDADYLSSIGLKPLTKGAIKKFILQLYPNEDETMMWKVLDYVMMDMIDAGTIARVGKTRYVVIS